MPTLTSPKAKSSRLLRADAQRNYDVLVAAADSEFTAHGADVSLEDIARRAKVGIGTLYRHFPTRDDLLAKVLNASTAVILERGRQLLDGPSPGANLLQWIRELVDYTATYRGLSAPMANGYVSENGTRLCSNCDAFSAAGAALLSRAQAAGEIRPDAHVVEVILSAHSAAWIAEQTKDRGAVERLLGILFDGLRAVPAKSSRRGAVATDGRRSKRKA
jgi:AcrR family transcriptional regulator